MQVGDLVWVTGRPRDGWVPFLGIIVEVSKTEHQYLVRACSHGKYMFLLDKCDMELLNEAR